MEASEEFPSTDLLMERITSSCRADREGGLALLSRFLRAGGGDWEDGERRHRTKLLRDQVASLLADLATKESVKEGQFPDKKLGCLSATALLIQKTGEREDAEAHSFIVRVKEDVISMMGDPDVRVRLLSGEVFGGICSVLGSSAYLEAKEKILNLLEAEFQRNKEMEGMMKGPDTPIDPVGEVAPSEPRSSPQLGPSPVGTPVNPNIALAGVLREAASALQSGSLGRQASGDLTLSLGCAQLESCLKCLQFIAIGLGTQFGSLIDPHLLELIFPALKHQNRFVRETGFFLCGTLIESGLDYKSMGKTMAVEIRRGLEDFCGQVRIAAAAACRKFMINMDPGQKDDLLPTMLPMLCLCRYYVADTKFLLYSQETWKVVFASEGPILVAKYVDSVVTYYIEATTSENHAVREAACLCLGELARKVEKNVVSPYVVGLLETLRRSFHDERWHVRDAACLAAGSFFCSFPEECQGQLEMFFPLFFENLQYPICTVRQGASAALTNTVKAYGKPVLTRLLEQITIGLEGVENQPQETIDNADLPIIMNPEMKYSYPPGQGPVPYARPSQPWELADGCVYLLGDMSQIPDCQTEIHSMIPQILKAVQYRAYAQHVVFLETVCKVLPCLINGIGKRQFKEYLGQFFEVIFYCVECGSSVTSGAGRVCLRELCSIYGPNIIRSRVELYDPRLVHFLDEG